MGVVKEVHYLALEHEDEVAGGVGGDEKVEEDREKFQKE